MDLLLCGAICLGSIFHAVSSQPSNIWCQRNISCTVDCAHQTVNGNYDPSMHCDDGATIKGYDALNLHILCNNGSFGCKQLQIECPNQDSWEPSYNFCRMDCTGDNGCFEAQIHNPESEFVEINCMNGNRTCNRMRITTTEDTNNKISVSCNTTTPHHDPICESIDIRVVPRQVTTTVIYIDCYAKGICHNISIASVNASIKISVFDDGEFTDSALNVQYLSLHLDTHAMMKDNSFIVNDFESVFAIELFHNSHLIYNHFDVVNARNVSISSDRTSVFAHNHIFGDELQSLHMDHVMMSHTSIRASEASIVHVYDSLFCNASYLNITYGDVLNIRNTRIASSSAIDAPWIHSTNVWNGTMDDSLLIVSHNRNVDIMNVSLHHNSRIIATYVSHHVAVNVGGNTVINGRSSIDATYANNFSLICNGLCDEHVSLYTPNASHKAYITCIEYGCKALDLYTFNNADDITFIPLDCPCNADTRTACIGSWNIHCAYNQETDQYLNESHFNSATQCVGDDAICCGDITHEMHEAWCKWPTNQFDCVRDTHCVIDCDDVNNTNNEYNTFACNTQRSIINATQALSLTVFCHEGEIGSCTNLTAFCPKQKQSQCHIYCDGSDGCHLLKIDAQTTTQLALTCVADKTCTDVMVTNHNKAINSDTVQLYCANDGCSTIQMYQMGHANVNVECSGNGGICNELWLDCTDCNEFTFDCAQDAWCTNSIFKATDSAHLALKCSATSNIHKGCDNITAYVAPHNTRMECDAYGCNDVIIYSLSTKSVSDAMDFNVTNCPCADEVDSLCIGEWSLYCNGDTHTPSIFSNGVCDGVCCGAIADAFHEANCSPFDCAVPPTHHCVVNCSDLVHYGYLCRNEVITPQATTASLDVYCADNVDCYGLVVYCNPALTAQYCNIHCEGERNCRNMTIYTQRIQSFTFTCTDGHCEHIFINNMGDDSAVGIATLAIHCDNSNCSNVRMYNLGSSSNVSLVCDTNASCTYDGIRFDGPYVTQFTAYGANVRIINSILNVENVPSVDINVSHMENTTIYGSHVSHSLDIVARGVFERNLINSSRCNQQSLYLLDSHASSNVIISPTVSALFVDFMCASQSCVFSNNRVYIDHVSHFYFNGTSLTNTRMNDNTFHATHIVSATILLNNMRFTNNLFNGDHAHNVGIKAMHHTNDTNNIFHINSIKSFTFECVECDQIDSDYFQLMHASFANFSLCGNISINATISAPNASHVHLHIAEDTWMVRGSALIIDGYNATNISVINHGSMYNTTIDAPHAQNILIEIGASAKITDESHFVLNAKHASLLQMRIDGTVSTHKYINTQNVSQYSLSGKGRLTESVINCDWCNALDIQLSHASNNRIDMNHGQILNIVNSSLFTNNTVNSNSVVCLNLSNNANVSMNTFHSLFVQQFALRIVEHSVFVGNVLYSNHTQRLDVLNYGWFQNNIVYGDNITKLFNFSCFGGNSVCGEADILWLNHAKNINIEIGEKAQNENSLNINGEHAQSIVVDIFGLFTTSWINGAFAKYLAIECAANHTDYGCHNVSIIASPSSSHLICTKYGCNDLILFTRRDANDVNITARQCPCEADVVDLCIDKWQIHCKNDTDGVSILTGLNQCNGSCCGDIQKTLEEKECKHKKRKNKNKEWIIYIVIAIMFGFYLIVAAIWIVRKKRKQNRECIDYMKTY